MHPVDDSVPDLLRPLAVVLHLHRLDDDGVVEPTSTRVDAVVDFL